MMLKKLDKRTDDLFDKVDDFTDTLFKNSF